MNLERYLEKRAVLQKVPERGRRCCTNCKRPVSTCYCDLIRAFDSTPEFVILIHRDERKRGVASGRMSHLCLSNSQLFEGTDFSHHEGVNAILDDPSCYPVVLYPNFGALNLSDLKPQERQNAFPKDKRLVVFLIDGTWHQARRMKRLSKNLSALPHICFTPPSPSRFQVRKQPHQGCYSTLEAIHYTIELMGYEEEDRHANLLEVFTFMVQLQVNFEVANGGAGRRDRIPKAPKKWQ